MQQVIAVSLSGRADSLRLNEDAYDALARYLARARSGLTGRADVAGALDDLERSIGGRIADRLGADDRVVTLADVEAVLQGIGPIGDARDEPIATPGGRTLAGRRLYRIREGQNIAGVCVGLAVYSEIDVGWVRTIFLAATVLSAGLFLVVYLVMAFVLPIVSSREEWLALMEAGDRSRGA